MSELNGRTKLCTGTEEFELPDGTVFELPIVEAAETIEDLYARHTTEEKVNLYAVIKGVIAYVQEATGVTLLGHQAWEICRVVLPWFVAKKKPVEPIAPTPGLPSSTESTLSN